MGIGFGLLIFAFLLSVIGRLSHNARTYSCVMFCGMCALAFVVWAFTGGIPYGNEVCSITRFWRC